MAFNWKTFQTRTLTAIIFAAVMLTGLLWNQWSFLILFSIIHFGCWWEYFNLLEKIHNTNYHRYTRIGFMLMGFAIMLWFCGPVYQINNYHLKENFSFPVSIAGIVMLVMGIFQTRLIKLKAFGTATLGLIYISLSWSLMLDISGLITNPDTGELIVSNYNREYPALIIFSIWINDTMAYVVGSLIGKTPLSKISPKKTWEGTVGGIILSAAVIFAISYFFNFYFIDPANAIVISITASVFGTVGDLFESKLKRMANVKDSGTFMPGHGGFLDRFDSLLFAIPVCWLLLKPCLSGPC